MMSKPTSAAATAAAAAAKKEAELKSRVELTFWCQNLVSMDYFSKSDPEVVVFIKNKQNQRWTEVGRTEKIKNDNNPKFKTSIPMEYLFEEQQLLRVSVFDIDNKSESLAKQDFEGDCYCTLGEIVGASNNTLMRQLKNDNKVYGKIFIRAEQMKRGHDKILTLRFSGTKLAKKDLFGLSDPFLVLSRVRPDGSLQKVAQTEVIKKTLDPMWTPLTVSMSQLCNNDVNQRFRMECFDWDFNSAPELIGQADVFPLVLAQQQKMHQPAQFTLLDKKNKTAGVIHCVEYKEDPCYSFLDYITGGYEISLGFAIDFTLSNGDPKLSTSLHHRNFHGPNAYQKAIVSIGDVVSFYDSDKKFPVLGFGAKFLGNSLSHCFYCNGQNNPEADGIQGILDAYSYALANVQLLGPTNFEQVIRFYINLANDSKLRNIPRYYILVIITDGDITDFDATKRAVIEASRTPMSIIIVGVGSSKFEAMALLDGDDGVLSDRDVGVAARDICQFVPFDSIAAEDLAATTLKEVPGQLLAYTRTHHIAPPTLPPADYDAMTEARAAAPYRY